MAEELRIVIVEEGAPVSSAPAEQPGVPAVQPPAQPQPVPGAPQSSATPALGVAAGSLARGDVRGALATATSGITTALSPLSIAAGTVSAGFVAAATATRAYVRTVERQVDELSGISSAVAQAAARSEGEERLALRRRAEQIGPELARAERLRSQFETASIDLQTQVLDVLLDIGNALTPLIEFLTVQLENIANLLETNNGRLGVLTAIFGPLAGPLLAALSRIGDDQVDDDADDEFMQLIFGANGQQPLVAPDGGG